MWSLIKLLPELLQFGKILLKKYEVAEAKERIRQQNEEVEEFIKDYEKDPEDALRNFWGSDSSE